ncbi:response regulator transcription factor [Ferruginibacter albus]|uniref:response regulator transcription factor n=1 Tax=Ferruginibacter albus TaxID=2875540 RepID=UPI001CC54769|nr:response regulator transcription factor [Ferruginibacter albus]UAY51551.1 response regulator transcription factor [Ferruginibacter albus]
MRKIAIGLVDDHQLFLKSLSVLLDGISTYEVVVEALNGKDLQEKLLAKNSTPDIILIDVNMPIMNGIETAQWLHVNYPAMKLVALSMNDNDRTIIDMIKAGCCAYLLKDTHPNELEKALNEINTQGYYNGDIANINYRRLLTSANETENISFTEKEKEFLQLACSDMTYKQIAGIMNITERAVDKTRETLFEKLQVQSRVGLALEAIRRKLATL